MSTLSIATTGLSAASSRLNVAASNIASAFTTGPLPATDSSGSSGSGSDGASSNANLPAVYAPSRVGGLVVAQNVDPAGEFVQLVTAKYSFAANAKVIQASSDMTRSLLDITV
jgi:flagellar basal-body rod protein FlgC